MLHVEKAASGMRTIAWLKTREKDIAVAERARARGLEVMALSQFSQRYAQRGALDPGFAGCTPAELRRGVESSGDGIRCLAPRPAALGGEYRLPCKGLNDTNGPASRLTAGDCNHIGRMRRQNQYQHLVLSEVDDTSRIVGKPELISKRACVKRRLTRGEREGLLPGAFGIRLAALGEHA